MSFQVEVPVRTYSLNKLLRMHWRTRQAHNKDVAKVVGLVLKHEAGPPPELPVVVLVTRVAPRQLDGHDNLQASLKHTVDTISKWLKVDDADPRVTWKYAQATGPKPRYYAVRIEVME